MNFTVHLLIILEFPVIFSKIINRLYGYIFHVF